ncbi:MAG: hypothetical protein JSY10_28000 [Paenibacillus sp.]|nr:hypothetical protein [Paenibacillus sp.]
MLTTDDAGTDQIFFPPLSESRIHKVAILLTVEVFSFAVFIVFSCHLYYNDMPLRYVTCISSTTELWCHNYSATLKEKI